MIKNFLNNLLLSILQRIPYVQKLEAELMVYLSKKDCTEADLDLAIAYFSNLPTIRRPSQEGFA